MLDEELGSGSRLPTEKEGPCVGLELDGFVVCRRKLGLRVGSSLGALLGLLLAIMLGAILGVLVDGCIVDPGLGS